MVFAQYSQIKPMAWLTKPKSQKELTEEQRRRRRGEEVSVTTRWFNPWQVVWVLAFVFMATLVTFVSFFGLPTPQQQVKLNQRPRVQIIADAPFSYTSELRTNRARKQASDMVGPSLILDTSGLDHMRDAVTTLEDSLNTYQTESKNQPADGQTGAEQELADGFTAQFGYTLAPKDIEDLISDTTPQQRKEALDDGLMTLSAILSRGVYSAGQAGLPTLPGNGTMFSLDIPGRINPAPVLDQAEAQRELRITLGAMQASQSSKTQSAIFRLVVQAVVPNLLPDLKRTDAQRLAAVNAVKSSVVQVRVGDVIVEPSTPATEDQIEMLRQYYLALHQHQNSAMGFSTELVQRFLFVALLLFAAAILVKNSPGQFDHTPKFYSLMALLLVGNLALLRFVIGIGASGFALSHPGIAAVLPWATPTMLAPMLLAVLVGPAPAVIVALLISMLFAMMTGDTIEVFLVNFLASLVVIHLARDVRVRARLVRAGFVGGLAAAACAAFLGLLNHADITSADVGRQMFVAALTGLLTAVAAIGILPLCENLFKITTDITLLELTDFNHPLLRKLQMVAPGSYHHSLMVANISERAAAEVGANPLMCRACSLYHDIGKTIKPEYFTENQRDGINPHEDVSPSMSALVIKSHVTEGLDLAEQYKLPKVIRDVIVQHHGTTLIKYFYHIASNQKRLLTTSPVARTGRQGGNTPPAIPTAPRPAPQRDDPSLDESFFRYDGPKPNFKESAIVALADCIEAASRSLRKVTPQSVEELIESLVNDRIEDHQLDDSPLTLQELKKIKQSFNFTILNMLHSRVQYPTAAGGDAGSDRDNTPPAANATKLSAKTSETNQAQKPPEAAAATRTSSATA